MSVKDFCVYYLLIILRFLLPLSLSLSLHLWNLEADGYLTDPGKSHAHFLGSFLCACSGI